MKMYILARQDLKKHCNSYPYVQAMHAVAEFLLRFYTCWKNGTMVLLKVRNENELKKWKLKLELREKKFSTFYEPDIGNQLTAIACVDDGRIFKDLKLLE